MHLTDYDRMTSILAHQRPSSYPSLLSPTTDDIQPFPLFPFAKVRPGDVVEDIETGTREVVRKGSFYEFLIGASVRQAKQLPAVYDVLRARE